MFFLYIKNSEDKQLLFVLLYSTTEALVEAAKEFNVSRTNAITCFYKCLKNNSHSKQRIRLNTFVKRHYVIESSINLCG
jgi:hypothetical protein